MIHLASHLGLALVWCGLVGSARLEHLIVGLVLGHLVLRLLHPVVGGPHPRRLPAAVGLGLFLLWEIVLATGRVAWEVVTPQTLRRPGIVAVPLDARTDVEITLLANMVTLTPGTLSLDLSEDRRTLFVHALFGEDPERVRHQIKSGFERRILRVLREES